MKVEKASVRATIDEANKLLAKEKNISPALKAIVKLLLVIVEAMADRFSKNSSNSSKPPSSDQNRKKKTKQTSNRKPGGQLGRVGKQLKPVKNPDKVEELKIDKRTLPKGNYTDDGYEARQIMDYIVSTCVTEYRVQILLDDKGNRFVAKFPEHVKRPIQYGPKIKASSVYMSQYQLIPYNRIGDYFSEQLGINLSTGSIFNFNKEAYDLLSDFEQIAKNKLIGSKCVHADETGINVNGKRIWLHTACNDKWTHFYPHQKRGADAMNEIGILPKFKGVLCHDHWKAYYKYLCDHSLCNAHHLRELEWSATEDKQKWATKVKDFLIKLNKKVDENGGVLTSQQPKYYIKRYRALLIDAQKECPPPDDKRVKGQRGKIKRSKSRNLLERLIEYEDDVLRFMSDIDIPFTNNQGENDLRMTKVQQKISGCFRSEEGAKIFCRVRAYLITCRKHDVGSSEALEILFKGKLPDFVYE